MSLNPCNHFVWFGFEGWHASCHTWIGTPPLKLFGCRGKAGGGRSMHQCRLFNSLAVDCCTLVIPVTSIEVSSQEPFCITVSQIYLLTMLVFLSSFFRSCRNPPCRHGLVQIWPNSSPEDKESIEGRQQGTYTGLCQVHEQDDSHTRKTSKQSTQRPLATVPHMSLASLHKKWSL